MRVHVIPCSWLAVLLLLAVVPIAAAQNASPPATVPSLLPATHSATISGISSADTAYLNAITTMEAVEIHTSTPPPTASVKPVETISPEVLAKYDVNHNGVLDPPERAAYEKDRAARHAERLRKYDTNHDGVLDDNERAAMQADLKRRAILAKYDVNHNGVLDPSERAAYEKDRAARRAERLRKYDTNHDGKLDDSERAAMYADLKRKTELSQSETSTDPAP